MMKVFMGFGKDEAICHHCGMPIMPKEPVVKAYKAQLLWHPACWIAEATAQLKPAKGELPLDVRARRTYIIRKGARIRQMIRELLPKFPKTIIRISKLWNDLEALKPELEQCGGLPKGWDITLGEFIAAELGDSFGSPAS
jgi:hypothetical protein